MFRLTITIALIFPCLAFAHSGRTDSSGCHNDNKGNAGYHCHNSSGSSEPDPEPNPSPITPTINYPAPTQDPSVVRGNIQSLHSFYAADKAKLTCIHTAQAFYSADLLLSPAGFTIKDLEQVEQCQAFSAKYSFITHMLTIFDISIGSDNYKTSLELNNTGIFNLFYAQKHGEDTQTSPGYNRDDWGQNWADKDGDCQDTRSEVLNLYNVYQQSNTCTLTTGLWIDPYTQFEFYDANDLDIDHLVSLAYAHKHGGANWSPALKNQFYNDMENLLPVSASSNRSKGSKSPAEWMPDNISYHCQYIDSFLYIVDKYHLDLSDTEKLNINTQCTQ